MLLGVCSSSVRSNNLREMIPCKYLVSTAGFSKPLVEQVKPVSLLVAVAPSKDGKEYLALSVTGASELFFF